MTKPPFERTTCACAECIACCTKQPGPLAPGDLERIAAHLGLTIDEAKQYFRKSAGALIGSEDIGVLVRVGTITPKKINGRCVFLDEHNHCTIHAVAPMGCAHFDMHMGYTEAQRRALWLIRQQMTKEYQELRKQLSS